jgi:serine/threonine protein phosphatase PrpC
MAYMIVTGKGPSQPINADMVKEWEVRNGNVYLVCDGINHNDKTLAAVNCFAKNLSESNWTDCDNPEKLLKDNIIDVLRLMSPEYDKLSFCCCIAIVFENEMTLAHCGDCRIGNLTNEGIKWLTNDHVPALKLYNQGKISKAIYEQCRHFISTKLKVGSNNHNSLTIKSVTTSNIQNLMLCSDGFWSEADHLLNTYTSNMMDIIQKEVERLDMESKDNFSIVIV